jgi:hypothetical protein
MKPRKYLNAETVLSPEVLKTVSTALRGQAGFLWVPSVTESTVPMAPEGIGSGSSGMARSRMRSPGSAMAWPYSAESAGASPASVVSVAGSVAGSVDASFFAPFFARRVSAFACFSWMAFSLAGKGSFSL